MVLPARWAPLRLLRAALRPPPLALPPLHAHLRAAAGARSPFSTTAAARALPAKRSGPPKPQAKGKRQARMKNAGRGQSRAPKTAPGERRRLRKQIVLSSVNAPALGGLRQLEPRLREGDVARVFAVPDALIDRLKTLGAFRTGQHWRFFHAPSVVLRREAWEMDVRMEWVENGLAGADANEKRKEEEMEDADAKETAPLESRHLRYVVHGTRGSGKSVLLLQMMAWALQRGWVVINVPEAQDLVIGHTEYEQDPNTKLWTQRAYTAHLLGRTHHTCKEALQNTTLSQDYTIGRHGLRAGTPLSTALEVGIHDPPASPEVLTLLLNELSRPRAGLPPVLFAVDGLNQLMTHSAYRDASFAPIHAHDLALPAAFLAFLSGARSFARGITVGATSASNAPRVRSLAYLLADEAQQRPPVYAAAALDERVLAGLRGAGLLRLHAMSADEVRALVLYCRDSGLVAGEELGETELARRIALSSGLPKEVLAGAVRLTV